MAISCKLNNHYKEAVKAGNKLITKHVIQKPHPWKPGETVSIVNYKYKHINEFFSGNNLYPFNSTSCCGIADANFTRLNDLYQNRKVWHKDFEAIVAWYMCNIARRQRDSRVFIFGAPIKVGRNSSYNVAFYKRLIKLLLKWGCQQVVQKAYTNKNSKNKLIVLVGQF